MNFLRCLFPCYEMPPAGPAPAPVPEPARRSRDARPDCEMCGCTLLADGSILAMSEKAKKFRKHEETIEELTRKVATLEAENRDLKAKLTPADAPRRSSVAVVGA